MCVPEYDFQIERTTISKGTIHIDAESEEEAQQMCEKWLEDLNSDTDEVMLPSTELDSDVWELE